MKYLVWAFFVVAMNVHANSVVDLVPTFTVGAYPLPSHLVMNEEDLTDNHLQNNQDDVPPKTVDDVGESDIHTDISDGDDGDDNHKAKPTKPSYEVSRSTEQMCWQLSNLPDGFGEQMLTETIRSPMPAKFVDVGSYVKSVYYQDPYTTTFTLSLPIAPVLSKCWNFDENDPLGDYTVMVVIYNQAFSSAFRLVQ